MASVMGRLERDVLSYLARNPKGVKKNADIAKATGSLRSSVSRSLSSLQTKGLVVRKFHKWTLSDQGKAVVSSTRSAVGPITATGLGEIKTRSINPPRFIPHPGTATTPANDETGAVMGESDGVAKVPVSAREGDRVKLNEWAREAFVGRLPHPVDEVGTVHAVEIIQGGLALIWVQFSSPELEPWRVIDLEWVDPAPPEPDTPDTGTDT